MLIAIITNVLLCINTIFYFTKLKQLNIFYKIALSITVGLFVYYIPVYNDSSVVMIIRGICNDFSTTTTLIFIHIYINYLFNIKHKVITKKFALVIALSGLILYLSTFGIICYDIYALGNRPNILLIFIAVAVIYLWDKKVLGQTNTFIWLFALLNFYFRLQISPNLWDYLLDPVLWFMSLFYLIF